MSYLYYFSLIFPPLNLSDRQQSPSLFNASRNFSPLLQCVSFFCYPWIACKHSLLLSLQKSYSHFLIDLNPLFYSRLYKSLVRTSSALISGFSLWLCSTSNILFSLGSCLRIRVAVEISFRFFFLLFSNSSLVPFWSSSLSL